MSSTKMSWLANQDHIQSSTNCDWLRLLKSWQVLVENDDISHVDVYMPCGSFRGGDLCQEIRYFFVLPL